MGRMSAAVAHEIRNPLAAIAQANDLLEEDVDDPKHRQLIRLIAQNASRLGKIVDEVLHLAHVQGQDNKAALSKIDLASQVEQVCQDWGSQHGMEVPVLQNTPGVEAQARFEPEHLRRVMINLLDNAKRYASARKGAIQVACGIAPATVDQARRVTPPPRRCEVRVWSDGAPLDASVEQHLFEPFFSSESRSSGLGLYICRELCEGHGATIHYQRSASIIDGQTIDGNEFVVLLRMANDSALTS